MLNIYVKVFHKGNYTTIGFMLKNYGAISVKYYPYKAGSILVKQCLNSFTLHHTKVEVND